MTASDQAPARSAARIVSLDVARGLAVVLMIVGHTTDAVLAPEARLTETFRYYETLRGLTAPLFLLLAGFAFSAATVRYWEDHVRLGARTGHRLLRAALLVAIGYALHLPFFSFGKLVLSATPAQYDRFLQADILQCVGLSLVGLQLTVLAARTPARHGTLALAAAAAIGLAAPVLWSLDLDGVMPRVLIPYLNQQHPTLFPLVPYAAYMFLGAAIGHSYLRARDSRTVGAWAGRMALGAALAMAAAVAGELIPWPVYPAHDYWKANPGIIATRAALVTGLVIALLQVRRFPGRLAAVASLLGQSSLFLYVAHLMLVYGSVLNPGLGSVLGRDLSTAQALGAAAAVLLAMTALAAGLRTLRRTYRLPLRIAQAGAGVLLIYLFMTRPY